jgi:thiol-disulfide isomerase/thioredoxin
LTCALALLVARIPAAPEAPAGDSLDEFRRTEQRNLQAFTTELARKKVDRETGEAMMKEYLLDMVKRYEAFRDQPSNSRYVLEIDKDIIFISLSMLDDEARVFRLLAAVREPEQAAVLKLSAAQTHSALGNKKEARRLAEDVLKSIGSRNAEFQSRASIVLFQIEPEGKPFPEFPTGMLDLDGKPIRLEDYKGKVVLVDFWGSWCEPCMLQEPEFVRIYRDYHARGFEIIGIAMDQDRAAMRKAIATHGVTWRQHFEGEVVGEKVSQRYGIRAIPVVYLIGPDGRVVRKIVGGGQQLSKLLGNLLPASK